MTDQQLDDRLKVLADFISAVDAKVPIARLTHEVIVMQKHLAELKVQLAKIERDVRTIKARQ